MKEDRFLYGPFCTLGVPLETPDKEIEWWTLQEGPDSVWFSVSKNGKQKTGVTLTSDQMTDLRKIFKKQIKRLRKKGE